LTGQPFDHIAVSIKDGNVMIEANSQVDEIKPTPGLDTLDADRRATITAITLHNVAKH